MVLLLYLKKIWLASDHYKNKRHSLHIFTDIIKLECERRLTGSIFKATGAFWFAEVNWNSITKFSDHPLMAVSFNIADIKVKVTFDYHSFLIGTKNITKIYLHNERDKFGNIPELLVVTLSSKATLIFNGSGCFEYA